MRPSLLDRADLGALRSASLTARDPWGAVVACLLAPGVVQYDPDDAAWPDRDRVVAGDGMAGVALDAALRAGGRVGGQTWLDASGGHALAVARGMAAASDADGGVFRVWCLLGEGALGDGPTLEAARDAPGGSLVVIAVGRRAAAEGLRALFSGAGWRVARARAREPAEVLGGLDRVLLPGPPGALVNEWHER